MRFDKCVQSCNHHHSYAIGDFISRKTSQYPIQLASSQTLAPGNHGHASVHIILPFLGFLLMESYGL